MSKSAKPGDFTPGVRYFRVRRLAPMESEALETCFELQPGNTVTRTVDVFRNQSRSNSIRILSHRSGAFSEYAIEARSPCLMGNRFSAPGAFEAHWDARSVLCEPITKATFERLFMSAKPDL